MKNRIICLMGIISLSCLGCMSQNEEVANSDTEVVLANLKEKFGIEYKRVDSVNDSSMVMSIEELQSFFDELERKSILGKSRIADWGLESAHSIEGNASITPRSSMIETYNVMGIFKFSGHHVYFDFDFEIFPEQLGGSIHRVSYIRLDNSNYCYVSKQDFLSDNLEFRGYYFLLNAETYLYAYDANNALFYVEWTFHISGLIFPECKHLVTYLSTETYNEKLIK